MTTPAQGQPFNSDEEKILQEMAEHWRKMWNEAPAQALTRVEDAAKQMIVVTSSLQGLYIAVFAFSNIRAQLMRALGGPLVVLVLFLCFMPLVCLLTSLFYATRVFVPRIRPGVNFNEISVSA